MGKYKSKLAGEVALYEDILRGGTLLAIDPSSGSSGSAPGYAIFEAGALIDAGTIAIPRGGQHIASRLWQLRNSLEKDFRQPDILAVELISPIMPTKNGTFTNKSATSLIKSVGAVISAWNVPTVEVSPITWHKCVDDVLKLEVPMRRYVKSDAKDAVAVGWAVLCTLALVLGETPPPMPEILRT